MDDKERLEELKEWFNNDGEIHQFQIEWLIEQAERYEKLLPKWNTHVDKYNDLMEERNKLVEEINQLRRKCVSNCSQD